MSDLMLSLPHYHRHSDLCSANNRHSHNFRSYVSFTGFAFYIAVHCDFDNHLYLTSCLNAHNRNTCIRLPQKVVLREKWHSSLLVMIAKHKYKPAMPWQPP